MLLSFSFAALQFPISHNDSTIYLIKVLDSQFSEFGSQPDKTADILDAITGFPAKWLIRNDRRNSVLMTRRYPDLGGASDLSFRAARNLLQPIRNTIWIWVVTRHQYGISALVSQTTFRGETSRGVAKFWLFSQATLLQSRYSCRLTTANTTHNFRNNLLDEWCTSCQ